MSVGARLNTVSFAVQSYQALTALRTVTLFAAIFFVKYDNFPGQTVATLFILLTFPPAFIIDIYVNVMLALDFSLETALKCTFEPPAFNGAWQMCLLTEFVTISAAVGAPIEM